MISPIRNGGLLVGAVFAATAVAGPVLLGPGPVNVPALTPPTIPVGSIGAVPSLPHGPGGPLVLANYPLSTTLLDNVLLELDLGVYVRALNTRIWGAAVVTSTGCTKDESLIGDITSFFKNPIDTITAAIGLGVRVDLDTVGGHFELDINAPVGATVSIPILEAELFTGIDAGIDVTAGLRLAVDVVLAIDAAIDVTAGFEFDLPKGTFITIDAITGDIIDQSFVGATLADLPIVVRSGSATIQAALRIRLEVGTEVEVFGTDFKFELGAFVDLVQYTAIIGSSPQCELFVEQRVDLAIGAFALVVLDIDYTAFLAVPADVVIVLGLELSQICLPRLALPSTSSSVAVLTPPATTSSGSLPSTTGFSNGTTTSSGSGAVTTSSGSGAVTTSYASGALTTSTVVTTDTVTITSCSSTVLNCPTSLTSLAVVTSTRVLYTTVCPVTETQKPTVPAAYPTNTPSSIVSAHTLTPVAPVVSTVYVPSVVTPTYTVPAATSSSAGSPGYPVGNPGYTASSAGYQASSASYPVSSAGYPAGNPGYATITSAPAWAPTGSASGVAAPTGGNGTSPTGGVYPTAPYVSNGAASSSGSLMVAMVVAIAGVVALM